MTKESENPYAPPSAQGGDSIDVSLGSASRLKPATRGDRLWAVMIDYFVFAGLQLIAQWMLTLSASFGGVSGVGVELFLSHVLAGVTFALINLRALITQGRTLGKRAMHLQIIDNESDDLVGGLRVVLLRYRLWGVAVVGSIAASYSAVGGQSLGYFLTGLILFDLLLILGPSQRCLHDRISGTRVFRYHSKRKRRVAPVVL